MVKMKRIANSKTVIALLLAVAMSVTDIKAQDVIYEKEDSIFIEHMIKKHTADKYDNTGNRITALAREFIGKDYIAGTLDDYDNEPLFVSSSRVDCTTFMETVLAVALCGQNEHFAHFCKNLELIRYRGGERNGYTSRLHYISWWITDPAKRNIIREIATPHHTATQHLDLNFMSSHPQSYKHLKDNPQATESIAKLERRLCKGDVKYIPKESIKEITEKDIKDGDIIAIVTAIDGLDVTHIGFVCWQKEELHMIHASSTAGKVINDTTSLADYLAKRKSHSGIRVFRMFQ